MMAQKQEHEEILTAEDWGVDWEYEVDDNKTVEKSGQDSRTSNLDSESGAGNSDRSSSSSGFTGKTSGTSPPLSEKSGTKRRPVRRESLIVKNWLAAQAKLAERPLREKVLSGELPKFQDRFDVYVRNVQPRSSKRISTSHLRKPSLSSRKSSLEIMERNAERERRRNSINETLALLTHRYSSRTSAKSLLDIVLTERESESVDRQFTDGEEYSIYDNDEEDKPAANREEPGFDASGFITIENSYMGSPITSEKVITNKSDENSSDEEESRDVLPAVENIISESKSSKKSHRSKVHKLAPATVSCSHRRARTVDFNNVGRIKHFGHRKKVSVEIDKVMTQLIQSFGDNNAEDEIKPGFVKKRSGVDKHLPDLMKQYRQASEGSNMKKPQLSVRRSGVEKDIPTLLKRYKLASKADVGEDTVPTRKKKIVTDVDIAARSKMFKRKRSSEPCLGSASGVSAMGDKIAADDLKNNMGKNWHTEGSHWGRTLKADPLARARTDPTSSSKTQGTDEKTGPPAFTRPDSLPKCSLKSRLARYNELVAKAPSPKKRMVKRRTRSTRPRSMGMVLENYSSDDLFQRQRSNTKPRKSFRTVMYEHKEGIKETEKKHQMRYEAYKKASTRDVKKSVAFITADQKKVAAKIFEKWTTAKLDTVEMKMEKIIRVGIPLLHARSKSDSSVQAPLPDFDLQVKELQDDIESFLVSNGYFYEEEGLFNLNNFPLFKVVKDDMTRQLLLWEIFLEFCKKRKKTLRTFQLVNIGLTDAMLKNLLRVLDQCPVIEKLNFETNQLTEKSIIPLSKFMGRNKTITELRLSNQLKCVSTTACREMVNVLRNNEKILRFSMDFREKIFQEKIDRVLMINWNEVRKKRMAKKPKKKIDVQALYNQTNRSKVAGIFNICNSRAMGKITKSFDGVKDNIGKYLIEGIILNKPRKMLMDKASISNEFISSLVDSMLKIQPNDHVLEVMNVNSNMIFGAGVVSLAKLVEANIPSMVDLQARNQSRTLGFKESKIMIQALQKNKYLKKLGMDFRGCDIAEVNKLISRNGRLRFSVRKNKNRFNSKSEPSKYEEPAIYSTQQRSASISPPAPRISVTTSSPEASSRAPGKRRLAISPRERRSATASPPSVNASSRRCKSTLMASSVTNSKANKSKKAVRSSSRKSVSELKSAHPTAKSASPHRRTSSLAGKKKKKIGSHRRESSLPGKIVKSKRKKSKPNTRSKSSFIGGSSKRGFPSSKSSKPRTRKKMILPKPRQKKVLPKPKQKEDLSEQSPKQRKSVTADPTEKPGTRPPEKVTTSKNTNQLVRTVARPMILGGRRRRNRAQKAQKPKIEERRPRGFEVEDQRIPDLKIEDQRTQGFKIEDQRTQGSNVKVVELRQQSYRRPRPNVMSAPPEIPPRRFEYPVQTMWSPHSPRLASRQGSVILQASPYMDLAVKLTRSEGSLPSLSRRRRPHSPVRDTDRKIKEV